MIKFVYYYFFYKIHKFTGKLGKYDVAFSSITGLVGIQLVNIITFILSINFLKEYFLNHYKIYIFFITLFLFTVNYFLFIYNDKYIKIEGKFSNESLQQRIIINFIVTIYVILSFILLFIVINNWKILFMVVMSLLLLVKH